MTGGVIYRCARCKTALPVDPAPPGDARNGSLLVMLVTPCKRCIEIARCNALDYAAVTGVEVAGGSC